MSWSFDLTCIQDYLFLSIYKFVCMRACSPNSTCRDKTNVRVYNAQAAHVLLYTNRLLFWLVQYVKIITLLLSAEKRYRHGSELKVI